MDGFGKEQNNRANQSETYHLVVTAHQRREVVVSAVSVLVLARSVLLAEEESSSAGLVEVRAVQASARSGDRHRVAVVAVVRRLRVSHCPRGEDACGQFVGQVELFRLETSEEIWRKKSS